MNYENTDSIKSLVQNGRAGVSKMILATLITLRNDCPNSWDTMTKTHGELICAMWDYLNNEIDLSKAKL